MQDWRINSHPSDRRPGAGLTLEVVVLKSGAIFQLLVCKDEPVLAGWGLPSLSSLSMISLGSTSRVMNGLAGQVLHQNLHVDLLVNVQILRIANQVKSPLHQHALTQCQSPLKDFHLFCQASLWLCSFSAIKTIPAVHSFLLHSLSQAMPSCPPIF